MRAAKSRRATANQSVIYVYGVARAPRDHESAAPQLDGLVADAPVHPLVHGNLLAFVSAVPAAQFGASEFRAALMDTEWLKERVLAHEKVLEELRAGCDVVPFRFGTVYLGPAQVSQALARHRDELCQALDRVEDASEWGVKLFCDRDALASRVEAESGAIRHLRAMLDQASPGARFFLQKKYVKALDNEVAAAIVSRVGRVRQDLAACSRESVDVEVQPPAVHGRSADMVMNAACLVPKGSLTKFKQAIAASREELAAHGFACELTGPWPPYHFVSVRQEGIADAASDR